MYRSGTWDKVPAWELETIVSQPLPGLARYTRQFFACWLTPEFRREVVAAARQW
jgi:hypothetical protein